MLTGDTVISDGVMPDGMAPLALVHSSGHKEWPVMGWDTTDTYWVQAGTVSGVERVTGSFKVYEFVTLGSGKNTKDASTWRSTKEHQLLCADGVYRPAFAIMAEGRKIQHVRGNGHGVTIASCKEIGDATELYYFHVRPIGCFIHNFIVHKAGADE